MRVRIGVPLCLFSVTSNIQSPGDELLKLMRYEIKKCGLRSESALEIVARTFEKATFAKGHC